MHAPQKGNYSPLDEEDIESIYRNLVQFSNTTDLHHVEGSLENTREKETVVWILMAVLGVGILIAFYLFWLKTGGY
jgi:hypothetical protein